MKHRLTKIDKHTFALEGTADMQAVMGAKTSRAPKIEARFEDIIEANDGQADWEPSDPPEKVAAFLEKNLAGYGHASIAEMAPGWVHTRNLGWPLCWLFEDTPLFSGQEVSTRAVDMVKASEHRCLGGEVVPLELHDMWMSIYIRVKNAAKGKGYKYDVARNFLPGTASSGVTMTMNVRDATRHLRRAASVSKSANIAAQRLVKGFRHLAPKTVDACLLRGDEFARHDRVFYYGLASYKGEQLTKKSMDDYVFLACPAKMAPRDCSAAPTPRTRQGTYMDPVWEYAPRLVFRTSCTVGAARDWHRHRPVMPWELLIILKDKETITLAPWVTEIAREFGVERDVEDATALSNKVFQKLHPSWDALYALPFGTFVRVGCKATLPKLLYMLELRAFAEGANKEYQLQAQRALEFLVASLPKNVVAKEKIAAHKLPF